jgi:predicted dehydrogenase
VLGIGLLGLGQHGERYARHLLAGDVIGARLVAVSRRDRAAGERWAAIHSVRHAPSCAALLATPGVDAVIVVLPPALHPDAVEAVAAAGLPLLVEKPLAPDPAGAQRACEAVARAGIQAMVAHTLRFNPIVIALRQQLPSLGRLTLIAINQRFEPINRDWLDRPEHGGLVLNTGIHGLDLLHHLSGARVVKAAAQRCIATGRQTEESFTALLTLEPGPILATLDNTRTTRARSGRIEACGERGQLLADQIHGQLARITPTGLESLAVPPLAPTIPSTVQAFVDAVRSGAPSPIPLEEGLAAVQAAALVREAAR